MESIFIREKYLNKVKPYIGKNIIKVLTGQRRVGKTTILRQIIDLVSREDRNVHTIYINMEHSDFKHIKNSEDLYHYVKTQLSEGKPTLLFAT